MRSPLQLAGVAAFALGAIYCSSGGVHVTTTAAPDANLTMLHSFRVLDAPQRRADAPSLAANDPMLDNSIMNGRLRTDLVQAFEQKHYVVDATKPDFLVAYYAGTMAKLDTTYWAPGPGWRYGYRGYGFRRSRYWSAWPWGGYGAPYAEMAVNAYTEGSVIIDVIEPSTMELLWRGQGVARVSDDPTKYAGELNRAVMAILAKFPAGGAMTQ